MIYAGSNIRSQSDELKRVDLDYIHRSIVTPRPDLQARVSAVRASAMLDHRSYTEAKKTLPYFVCASFNPPYRRLDNFAYVEYFFVDIDGISLKGRDKNALSERLKNDNRVVMLFTSPGGDGLKVLFRLSERCYDPGVYSLFYKSFARRLDADYGLDGLVDTSTSDVTRACFYSVDPEAYYNPFADCIDLSAYVDTSDVLGMFDLKREMESESKEQGGNPCPEAGMQSFSDPDESVLDKIKCLLAGKAEKLDSKTDVFVPEELSKRIPGLVGYMEGNGLCVGAVRDIQYGKKIDISLGSKSAEINIFFGKRGYTVVNTTKRGTSLEFGQTCRDLARLFLSELAS